MKKFCRKFHIYLSLFFAPMALLYAISGIAYLSGIKQDTGAEVTKIIAPIPFDYDKAVEIITQTLQQNQIKLPSNLSPRGAKGGGIVVGGIDYEVVARKKGEQTLIIVTNRTLLGDMILLHKGKGEWYFNLLGFGFGIALCLLYLSGIIVSYQNKERYKMLSSLAFGTLIVCVLGYLSVF